METGAISGYESGTFWGNKEATRDKPARSGKPLAAKMLAKSASIRGFFLLHYTKEWKPHLMKLGELVQAGKLISAVDTANKFHGLEEIPAAIGK